jgi:hypothetical protein
LNSFWESNRSLAKGVHFLVRMSLDPGSRDGSLALVIFEIRVSLDLNDRKRLWLTSSLKLSCKCYHFRLGGYTRPAPKSEGEQDSTFLLLLLRGMRIYQTPSVSAFVKVLSTLVRLPFRNRGRLHRGEA